MFGILFHYGLRGLIADAASGQPPLTRRQRIRSFAPSIANRCHYRWKPAYAKTQQSAGFGRAFMGYPSHPSRKEYFMSLSLCCGERCRLSWGYLFQAGVVFSLSEITASHLASFCCVTSRRYSSGCSEFPMRVSRVKRYLYRANHCMAARTLQTAVTRTRWANTQLTAGDDTVDQTKL